MSNYMIKVVGVNAWVTAQGVIAYIRHANIRRDEQDDEVTWCRHKLVSFRRQRSNPIILEAWSGPVRPVEEVIETFGPFSKKPFPEIYRTVSLHPVQLGRVIETIPQQPPRRRGFVCRDRKPVVKSRIVRVELGRDSRMPRQMNGWTVEAVHLVGIERKATEGVWDCGKLKMPSCAKGYPEPIVYGDLELEYLRHMRTNHIYLDVKDPNQKGQALFLVRFRKGELSHGNV